MAVGRVQKGKAGTHVEPGASKVAKASAVALALTPVAAFTLCDCRHFKKRLIYKTC